MIQKLEQYVIGANYGCGGASFSEVIDKVNEVIDYINSRPEEIPPCQIGFTWDEYRREVAKDILCAIISGGYGRGREEEQAHLAVQYADELIKALREESK